MTFDYSEIFGDIVVESQIQIEEHLSGKGRLCVLGVLDNSLGREIKQEMLSWITEEYDVYCVIQKEPGELFEYPALRFAQWLCQTGQAMTNGLLYVHTKGAGFKNPNQKKIRELWKNEFAGTRVEEYIRELDKYDAVCLMSGPERQTWYNGMFISKKAFANMPCVRPYKDRFAFQRLFSKMRVKGMLKESVTQDMLTEEMLGFWRERCRENERVERDKQDERVTRDKPGGQTSPQDYSVTVEWTKPKKKKK